MPLDGSRVQSESDVQGDKAPDPGAYHVIVNRIDPQWISKDGAQQGVVADLLILAGIPEQGAIDAQVNRTLRHTMFFKDGDYTDAHLRFALATGVIRPGEKADYPDWQKALHAQLKIRVEAQQGQNNRVYHRVANWGLDLWHVDNPEASAIPVDQRTYALMKGQAGQPAQPAPGAPQPGGPVAPQPGGPVAPGQPTQANAYGNI